MHNQAVGSFHPSSADTAGDTWTEWVEHDRSIMKELCKRGFHFFLLSYQFFYSSHCIPLHSLILLKKHHSLLSFVLLFAFHHLIFSSFIIPSSLFSAQVSSAGSVPGSPTHTQTQIHSHWSFPEWNSVTPRWVFGSVQIALGREKNSPCRVWLRWQTILVAACAKEHLLIHENRKIC